MDASGSVGQSNFRKQLDFIQESILGLNVGQEVRVGLLTYGDTATIRFNLNDYNTKLDALNAMSVYYMGKYLLKQCLNRCQMKCSNARIELPIHTTML